MHMTGYISDAGDRQASMQLQGNVAAGSRVLPRRVAVCSLATEAAHPASQTVVRGARHARLHPN